MFTPAIRLLIGIGGLLLAVYSFIQDLPIAAYLALLTILLVIWGYFTNGTVYLAWRKIKNLDFDNAERILSQTRFPELLKNGQRGYYHFIRAYIEINKQDFDNASENLKTALKFGVRTENNQAIINLYLADIEFDRGRISASKSYLQTAKTMKYNDLLKPEIQKMEEKINSTT